MTIQKNGKLQDNTQNKQMNYPNEQLSDVILVSRPLDGWGNSYIGSGQGIISKSKETYGYWIGHHAVIAITESKKYYVLHHTSDLEFIIEPFNSHQFRKSDYLSEDQKKILPKISLQELYDAGLGDNQPYNIFLNNCVHALNRMKAFINKKLKEIKEKELEQTTNAGTCAIFGIVLLGSLFPCGSPFCLDNLLFLKF